MKKFITLSLFLSILCFGITYRLFAQGVPPALDSALQEYFKIGKSLSDDSLKGVPEAAKSLKNIVQNNTPSLFPEGLLGKVDTLIGAKDLDSARLAFKDISDVLIGVLRSKQIKTGKYFVLTCPMAQASWIQPDKEVKNPYYGSAMLLCGDVTEEF
ncbi:DUF3347 domain-containing protein [Candidatus Methylacidiphilum fumarolicum]|uniref:Predicted metal transporter n=2 Tax=Candidatus Methylacidiphilum fumarolicum TaxID=591154 RepID=I0JVY8_METFB|nr:DUF3347 domain-containing protein [Candidatus Methylacidiphilum fumarolicum]MBW6415555.1 DUF3347 domain-containing protein [Candidatus Methylacidiphilum fumarolicum]TFE68446.1 metal transporter [Candidatus Methylacidiphilum fumarolicum]TFE73054.1 DUF3347 domain-containing protein [Candidatus Methylacidiphilum fumarolicum]TFE73111.1 DUF3347 domain-containing protein [Candidatus Methylacidiphilum fumarolicum]TFE77098.1 metal transporter [Candidatus Methylacidiphilum fumarolicum]